MITYRRLGTTDKGQIESIEKLIDALVIAYLGMLMQLRADEQKIYISDIPFDGDNVPGFQTHYKYWNA